MLTIEGHPDFGVLEQRLISLVLRVKNNDPAGALAPLAIVAPTGRLLSHLRGVLADALPGLLNVHFLHHDALIQEVAAGSALRLPGVIPTRVRQDLLATLLARIGGPLADFVALRPGSRAALLDTVDDLREAGVSASPDIDHLSPGGRDIMRLYARYSGALDRFAHRHLSDRAGQAQAVLPLIADFARRFRLVIHYGAYELIGANLDLLRAIESSGVPVALLVPYHPAAPAYAHARRFWPELLKTDPVSLPDTDNGGRLLGNRLTALYDEASKPFSSGTLPIECCHAQGALSELREVALRILALHRDEGIPLRRMAVIGRSLEPYAPLLRTVFTECRLPFDTSAVLGALREASVQAALQLARSVLGGYERQPLMDLLRGGQFQRDGRGIGSEAQAWDRLSREYRVARGYESWSRDLPAAVARELPHPPADADQDIRAAARGRVERRQRQARALSTIVRALHRAAAPASRARDWKAWCDAMEALFRDHLKGFREAENREIAPGPRLVLRTLRDMHHLDAAGVPFSRPTALAHFEGALANGRLAIGSVSADGAPSDGDNGGVHILDTMQARGLAFDVVFLIGFNSDLFPRRPREDPLLEDRDRLRLRERTGRPLPLKARSREEEHLLLALMLGSSRQRLVISWQRADEAGSARVPSLALREIARLERGVAEFDALVRTARRIPTHPADAGRDAAVRLGLLPAPEARLSAAMQLRSPKLLLEALPSLPPSPAFDETVLIGGLRMLRVIEEFAPDDLQFDAFVGTDTKPPAIWSPSRLELLGNCPQRYFFRHLLRVDELTAAGEGYEIPLADLGGRVHQVLHETYRTLLDGPESASAERAEEILRRAWDHHTEHIASLMAPRYPLLWEAVTRQWLDGLLAFVRHDLAALAESGGTITGLEQEINAEIAIGSPQRKFTLRGRLDRIARTGGAATLVSDYKSAGDPGKHVSMAAVLKGERLQMPLYLLLAESPPPGPAAERGQARAEVLGVGPAFTDESGAWNSEIGRAELDPEKFASCRAGFEESLAVLLDLAEAGHYPFNAKSRLCDTCTFRRACRRTHAPTRARLEAAPEGRSYALLGMKSSLTPSLAEVRRKLAAKENR